MNKASDAPMTRRLLEEKIVARAWKDDAFRKAFLADPKGQFEKNLGTKLPGGLKVTAWQEDENHLHFVIPARPAGVAELSDADLEKVAGGVDVLSTAVIVSAVASVAVGTASATAVVSIKTNENHHWGRG